MKHLVHSFFLIVYMVSIYSCSKNNSPVGSNVSLSWTNALQGTNVSSIYVSGNNLLAGSWGGIIFLSTDNGFNWRGVDTLHSVGSGPYTNFFMIPSVTIYRNGLNLFAGAGNTLEGSVYISTDNGLNWTEKDTNFVQCVNCFSSIDGTIFAGTNNGVYLSTNNGTSWTAANTGIPYQVVRLATIDKDLFAGTSFNGVFLSTNNGMSWYPVNNGLPNTSAYISINGLASIGTELFASVFHSVSVGDSIGGVFVSTNNGINWNPVNTGLTNRAVGILYADGSNLLVGTNIGVFLSTNKGTSWSILDSILVTSFAVDGSNLLAGTSNGILNISL